ncbi:MAG: LysE family transporter [bacterium]|nr:LysE family transporter [bacterium]
MVEAFALLKGIVIGLIIALPSGPVGFICLRRIFTYGRTVGFVSGIGTSLGDAIYAFVAAIGVTTLSGAIPDSTIWIQLLGGGVLVVFGIKIAFSKPMNHVDIRVLPRYQKIGPFFSAFGLTLANPSIIFSFAALFAGLGFTDTLDNYAFAGALSGGIFLGACVSWFLVSRLEQTLRSRLTPINLRWIDIIIGCTVVGFGFSALFISL